MDANRRGRAFTRALAAYFIWGIAPAYFKLIAYVPADEILTHRVIWSFFHHDCADEYQPSVVRRQTLKTPKKVFLLALSAVLIVETGCCLSGR